MYLITLFAEPKPETENAKKYGGALVNCWVNAATAEGAENYSRRHIAEDDWIATDIDNFVIVERQDYENDSENGHCLQYFLEAEADGGCLVFHTWPLDAEDADDINDVKAR